MKHQQVTVDYWTMGKTMLTYGFLTALCWLMIRLFHTAFTLPRRLRAQQHDIQSSLQQLQSRFPDLNITEEDLINAEKDLEEIMKENALQNKIDSDNTSENKPEEQKPDDETKKSI